MAENPTGTYDDQTPSAHLRSSLAVTWEIIPAPEIVAAVNPSPSKNRDISIISPDSANAPIRLAAVMTASPHNNTVR